MKIVKPLSFPKPDVSCGPGVYIEPLSNDIVFISEYADANGRLKAYCSSGEYYHAWGKYCLVEIEIEDADDE